MRRGTDKLSVASAAVCLLCVAVLGFVIAPTVLDTSSRTTDAEQTSKANRALIGRVDRALRRIDRESATRERQFCGLVLGVHRDRVKRLKNTRAYLRHPLPSLRDLNTYIQRVSLPQLVSEVRKERARLPAVCLK